MAACPSELELERFLDGTASSETVASLEAHRAECDACRNWLRRAQEDEELLPHLRAWWSESPDEPALPDGVPRGGLSRYRIGRLLGSGGMGAVYEAEQQSPRRRVALKVVRPGCSSADLLRRFELEGEVLGRLDHPGIARIHEAGTLGSGSDQQPFFAMEFVEGRPLTDAAAKLELDVTQRLGLFVRICRAVEHAHQKGVIHRDLKPANILVADNGEPKVLDFGVARVVDAEAQHATLQTDVGQIVGTLAYTSPEQVAGDAGEVDARSDVYSLGVILYELLSGERPYEVNGRPLTDAVRVVREQDPRPLGAARASLRGDLETITAKALEKEPGRRYASAGELGDDVERHLNREPIHARPPSAAYRAVRFVQRHRALVAGTLAVVATLVVGLLVSLSLKQQSDDHAKLAQRERRNVLSLSAFLQLEELREQADELWPVRPGMERAGLEWLDRVDELVAGLHPNTATGEPGHYALRDEVSARATSPDASDDDRWWLVQLENLIAEIESFTDPDTGLEQGISRRAGWGVRRRLEQAARLEERTVSGPEATRLWEAAAASIADVDATPYRGLRIEPVLGLLPLGRDPSSGLWEFAHVLSGELPPRDGAGSCYAEPETCVVLVLLPGGTFTMGAQASDASAPGYDAAALPNEGPVHEVTLSPFFLSKFELTQGQWLRLTGYNPAHITQAVAARPRPDGSHPVENVSWSECEETLLRFGLTFPSEAQWEYGARAGTTTPWWTGNRKEDLVDAANLADARCKAETRAPSWVYESWDDGYRTHAPVGTYRANPFGLHDVHGNVWEWCLDGLEQPYPVGPDLDPVASRTTTDSRVARGGCVHDPAVAVRSAIRNSGKLASRSVTLGVRPARGLDPR